VRTKKIGAVILAAGESLRFGRPKQLLEFRGKSLLRRSIDAAAEAGCSPIVIVIPGNSETESLGDRAELRESMAREAEHTAAVVRNDNWRSGIGTSIRAGVEHLVKSEIPIEAIALLVCDQPFVAAETIKGLIAMQKKTNQLIVASAYSETLGVPALFDRSCFPELLALSDESGAKPIILRDRKRVAEFPFPEGAIDIDTMADHEKLK
jgi:molybdenum cofactor cytidylyltransferase